MKIISIEFDDNDEQMPEKINVQFSLQEAAAITEMFGRLSPATTELLNFVPNNIYETLTGLVFNAYFENGVDDVIPNSRHKIDVVSKMEVEI